MKTQTCETPQTTGTTRSRWWLVRCRVAVRRMRQCGDRPSRSRSVPAEKYPTVHHTTRAGGSTITTRLSGTMWVR